MGEWAERAIEEEMFGERCLDCDEPNDLCVCDDEDDECIACDESYCPDCGLCPNCTGCECEDSE